MHSSGLSMESVKVNNIEPTHITADNVLSDSVCADLISLVDTYGKRATWSYNPDCIEFQVANPFSKDPGITDDRISACLPELYKLSESCMRKGNLCFGNTACETITGHHGFWILKYEEGGEFGLHCDWDSGPNGIRPPVVATAAVLLNDNFRGGETLLMDSMGGQTVLERPKGSMIMWDGFTQHRVSRVTEGCRYALVIHYTGTIK